MQNLSLVLTTVFILFIVRLVTLGACFSANFESLWRPGLQSGFPASLSLIIIFAAIFVIYKFVNILKNTNEIIKNSFYIYIGLMYCVLVFFSRDTYNTFSYQYLIQGLGVDIQDLKPFIFQDLFYGPPYGFWGLLFILAIYTFFKLQKKLEYAFPFLIIPFLFINFMAINDIMQCIILVSLTIAILGFVYSKGKSPFGLFLLQFIIMAFITGYIYFIPSREYSLKFFCQLLAIFYIPAFILMGICYKSVDEAGKTISWIIPAFTNFFLFLPVLRLPTQYCYWNSVGFIETFVGAGSVTIIVAFIWLISSLIGRLSEKFGKYSFVFLSICVAAFYLLDALLFYYSQLRLSFATLSWTVAMNDVVNTTLKTCAAYLSPTAVLFVFFLIIALISISFYVKKQMSKNSSLRFNFLIILLGAQLTSVFMTFSDCLPVVLRDPITEFISSIPFKLSKANISYEDIKTGFEKCNLPIKEYNDGQANKGNNYNLILVTLESVHWKYINMFGEGKKTWPELSKFKDRMEIFPFFFSVFPESTSADFSVLSGLQAPNHIYIENKALITYPTIAHELKKANYNNYYFASSSPVDGNCIAIVRAMPLDYSFAFTMNNLESDMESWTWGYTEGAMVKKILEYLEQKSDERPYCLWYRTICPHAPFEVLPIDDEIAFKKEANDENSCVTDYKNNLLYLDKQLSNLVQGIDKLDKKNNTHTVIALIADHGEMIGEKENNSLNGHGPFASPNLTAVPFILINPQESGLKINNNIGSQIDVLPTLLDKLNLTPSVKRFGQGSSLLSEVENNRPVYISSMNSYALIQNGFYYYFPNKFIPNAFVSKISLSSDFKPKFEFTDNVNSQDLLEKYNMTKKYFELNEQLMNLE